MSYIFHIFAVINKLKTLMHWSRMKSPFWGGWFYAIFGPRGFFPTSNSCILNFHEGNKTNQTMKIVTWRLICTHPFWVDVILRSPHHQMRTKVLVTTPDKKVFGQYAQIARLWIIFALTGSWPIHKLSRFSYSIWVKNMIFIIPTIAIPELKLSLTTCKKIGKR